MRAFLAVALWGALLCATAQADVFSDTWIRGASSVASNDDLTALFVNPAGLGMYDEAGFYGSLSMSGEDVSGVTLALKQGFFGMGYERRYLWQPCTLATPDGPKAVWLTGTYADRYRNEGGTWMFSDVKLAVETISPFTEGWAKRPFWDEG